MEESVVDGRGVIEPLNLANCAALDKEESEVGYALKIEEMGRCGEVLRRKYECYVLHPKTSSGAARILGGIPSAM